MSEKIKYKNESGAVYYIYSNGNIPMKKKKRNKKRNKRRDEIKRERSNSKYQ